MDVYRANYFALASVETVMSNEFCRAEEHAVKLSNTPTLDASQNIRTLPLLSTLVFPTFAVRLNAFKLASVKLFQPPLN